MTDTSQVYDEQQQTFRPKHKGRVRSLGGSRALLTREDVAWVVEQGGEVIEVYEGGRFVGYEKVVPERKYLPGVR